MGKKLKHWLATLLVVALGGFIGYDPNTPSQTLNAEEVTRIRWIDVPKSQVDVLGMNKIDINMQDETVKIDGNVSNTTVTIKKVIERYPLYITKMVEKPIRIDSTIVSRRDLMKLFNKAYPAPERPQTIGESLSCSNRLHQKICRR